MSVLDRFRLDGRRALVTGGGTGIGKGLAQALAEAGADVAVCGRTEETLERTVAEIESLGARAKAIHADVTCADDVCAAVQAVVDDWGGLDIAVNNAGITTWVDAVDMPEDDWDRVLDTFALPGTPAVELPPADQISARGGGGEGAEHRRLKAAVSVNPRWLGLPNGLSPGKVETNLRSGDSLDVLFSDSNRRIAVEVKGASAPVDEVIRGLFQCIKYEAVLDAEARVTGSRADCEAVLALGGSFPGELTPLRHTLGVRVFENLG